MSLEFLRPLIVPNSYFEHGDFPAPHVPLKAPDLALTCVLLKEPASMLYVQPQTAIEWQQEGIWWQVAAINAMRKADGGLVWTKERRDGDGSLMWIGLMHDDGLGSSRLQRTRMTEESVPTAQS
jgi:hypothetical protein